MECKHKYEIKNGNRKQDEQWNRTNFYTNVPSYRYRWADKFVDCDMCDSSIGIEMETHNCDDMSDSDAIEVFQNEGWFLDPKTMTKLCPECKKKVKEISENI